MEALERQIGQKNEKMKILRILSAMLAIFPAKLVMLIPWSRHSRQDVFLAKQLDLQYWPHMALNRHWFLATSQAMKRCFLTCTWLPNNTFL